MQEGAKLVHVVPITRSIGVGTLSYFSTKPLTPGSLIKVPLRKKDTPALVVGVENVKNAKARLRTSDFQIRKIEAKEEQVAFYKEFFKAIERVSDYYVSPLGATIALSIPKVILDSLSQAQEPKERVSNESNVKAEKLVLQMEREERVSEYKNIVREEFARGRSVFICTGSLQDAERLFAELEKGIERYSLLLHSGLTKKKFLEEWNAALKEEHPVVVVGTPHILSLPRHDLATIIVEHEHSNSYRRQDRSQIDMRLVSEFVSEELNIRLILADLPLRVSSIYRHKNGELNEFSTLRSRVPKSISMSLVDMRKTHEEKEKKKEFVTLGDDLVEGLQDIVERKERGIVFVGRRGLSPITVCLDCGNTVTCEITDAPVVLHKGKKENLFVCHASGTVRSAKERCKHCDSWRLESLGVGTQRVLDEVKKRISEAVPFLMDSDHVKTHAQAKKLVKEFYQTEGAVLIGTEMMLPYLTEKVSLGSVASIDSLLSLPEWNVYEKVFYLLLKLREITENTLIVQSRKTEQKVLEYALSGNLIEFYKEELALRERFYYPPFARLIRITATGGREKVLREIKRIEELLAPHGFSGSSHVVSLGRNRFAAHGFLRLKKDDWPNEELLKILRSFPEEIVITVDPPRIL